MTVKILLTYLWGASRRVVVVGIEFGYHGLVQSDREMEQRMGHPLRSVTETARDKKVFALAMTGRSLTELAEAFQITEAKVQSILDEYRSDPDMLTLYHNMAEAAAEVAHAVERNKHKRKPASRVTDSHILDALRYAMQDTGCGVDMSESEYNEWRAKFGLEAPGTRTIRRRFGWNRSKHIAMGITVPEGNFENVVDNVA